MATYVVMERRRAGEDDAEAIRDGFSLLAFVAPFLWLLWHRLWMGAAAYVAVSLALIGLGWLLGLGDAAGLLALPLNLLVGLEASTLRQAGYSRRGWSEWGPVEAASADEAVMRYLAEAGHLDAESEVLPELPMHYTGSPAAGPGRGAAHGPALGLFAYPDRR